MYLLISGAEGAGFGPKGLVSAFEGHWKMGC